MVTTYAFDLGKMAINGDNLTLGGLPEVVDLVLVLFVMRFF